MDFSRCINQSKLMNMSLWASQKRAKQKLHCSLVIPESHVEPMKSTLVPRLELTAAVLSTKMSQCWSRKSYSLQISWNITGLIVKLTLGT